MAVVIAFLKKGFAKTEMTAGDFRSCNKINDIRCEEEQADARY